MIGTTRPRGSFGAMLTGAALLLATMLTLFWNEGRTLKRSGLLDHGRAQLVVVGHPQISPGNEGKLVYLHGEVVGETLRDPDFGIETNALALRRRVEMLQWKQGSRERKDADGKRRTEYEYSKVWSDRPIDHSRFHFADAHQNPAALPFADQQWQTQSARLGAFTLDARIVDELRQWRSLDADADQLPPNLAASLRSEAGVLTSAASLDDADIGDVRIRFDHVPPGPVSLVAQQHNGVLRPYRDKRGELLLVERGQVGAQALFDAAGQGNSTLGWSLRLGGFFAFWAGFGLLLSPIRNLLQRIPLLGGIGRFATSLVSGLLAFALALLTMASGWLFHRPWLMALFLLAVATFVYWMIHQRRPPVATPVSPPPPPPPPPPGP
ncbi:MAG: TMEM43 family protein [Lysobacteraceae bacterium]